MSLVLGVSCFFHDAAACVVEASTGAPPRVLAAVAEERLSRVKHDRAYPRLAVARCLDLAAVEPGALDAVAFYEKPLRRAERAAVSLVASWPRGLEAFARKLPETLREAPGLRRALDAQGVRAPLRYVPHHLSHAADAFYGSGFERAAVLVVDGVGEWATTTVAHGTPEGLRLVEEVRYPHSLGLFYAMITAHLGFRPNHDEAKVMALAATGHPTRVAALERVLRGREDGGFDLDLAYCAFPYDLRRMATPRLAALVGPARAPGEPLRDAHRDLAASAQRVLEARVVALARRALRVTGEARLCLAGGVALNGVANGLVARESGCAALFVPPAPGDDGACVGAAQYVLRRSLGHATTGRAYEPRLGPAIDPEEAARALAEAGLHPERHTPASLPSRVAELVARGALVAHARGRMEFGPRALGCRSILGDPRDVATRDALNLRVKGRDDFQPFAPVVPEEDAGRFFACEGAVPWMSRVVPVRPEARAQIPAVVHADGSARVQTLAAADDPHLHAVLRAFEARAGVPVLVNTSFNGRDEPIVASARDAVASWRRMGLDALVLGDLVSLRPV